MIFYDFVGEEGYEIVNPCNEEDYEKFLFMGDKPWGAVPVRLTRADWRQTALRSDFPCIGMGALIMRQESANALADILKGNGECLPLLLEDGSTLSVFKAQVIDALDREASDLDLIPGTDRIMLINRPVFFADKVRGVDVFRLPHRASATYVSQRIVDRVKELGLKGIAFEKVWSAE
ncbi:DUF1629 domain-containing protein [Sphingomonas sp.]|uniref:imm11 family protein n=1 Tax=Sphingomonas sp. TaxID=28214 RepID=UPI001ECF8DF3|nr:DUF1629 domain-containing protein [Sphingomonas sp.]MBX3595644.1 hypothetical protein [Sphingomonas sp.]